MLIGSRPVCRAGKLVDWRDKIKISSIRDGTSNTFLVGEAHIAEAQLTIAPVDGPHYSGREFAAIARVGGPSVPIVRNRFEEPPVNFQFGSFHPQICNFALADGSVRAVSNTIDTLALGRLCNRRDGEIINYTGF